MGDKRRKRLASDAEEFIEAQQRHSSSPAIGDTIPSGFVATPGLMPPMPVFINTQHADIQLQAGGNTDIADEEVETQPIQAPAQSRKTGRARGALSSRRSSGATGSSSSSTSDSDWKLTGPAPGGPLHGDLLSSFKGHVAYDVWQGVEREVFRCHIRHMALARMDRAATGLGREIVLASDLSHLPACMFSHVNMPLLSAFVERWQPETNSFHLPFGEMTVTLHDVHFILGLPVIDRPMVVSELEYREKLLRFFSDTLQIPMQSLKKDWGHGGIKMKNLATGCRNGRKDGRVSEVVEAQCYPLYLLGGTIFVDKTASLVSGYIFPSLMTTEVIGRHAWGAAALAYLYRQLGLATRADCCQLAGCLTLLEVWIYEHFPMFRPSQPVMTWSPSQPWAHRWRPDRPVEKTIERLREYRMILDSLRPAQVIWMSYDYQAVQDCWMSRFHGCLRFLDIIEPYMPMRVLRQFEHVQSIPVAPIQLIVNKYCRSRNVHANYIEYETLHTNWASPRSHLFNELGQRCPIGSPEACMSEYYEWLIQSSHICIQNSEFIPHGISVPQAHGRSDRDIINEMKRILVHCTRENGPQIPQPEFREMVYNATDILFEKLNHLDLDSDTDVDTPVARAHLPRRHRPPT